MKVIGFSQLRNEHENGNLIPWLNQMSEICHKIYIFDQNSDDGSIDIYKKYNTEVIYSNTNNFFNELKCKQELLTLLQKNEGYENLILWVDGDTFIDNNFSINNSINLLINRPEITHLRIGHYNLWRSDTYYRFDGKYHNLNRTGRGLLWRNAKDLQFNIIEGLHHSNEPVRTKTQNLHVFVEGALIHRGFATDFQIIKKYENYKSLGQSGYNLERLLDEHTIEVAQLNLNLIPVHLPKNLTNPKSLKPLRDIYNERFL